MEEIEKIVQQLIETYKNNLKEGGHVATGDLMNNISYKIKTQKGDYRVEIIMEEYWKYLETGTKPHFPPLEAIRKWITIKQILPRMSADGRLPTLSSLAYLIGRKISLKGTPRLGLMAHSLNEIDFKDRILDIIFRTYSKELEKTLKQQTVS